MSASVSKQRQQNVENTWWSSRDKNVVCQLFDEYKKQNVFTRPQNAFKQKYAQINSFKPDLRRRVKMCARKVRLSRVTGSREGATCLIFIRLCPTSGVQLN